MLRQNFFKKFLIVYNLLLFLTLNNFIFANNESLLEAIYEVNIEMVETLLKTKGVQVKNKDALLDMANQTINVHNRNIEIFKTDFLKYVKMSTRLFMAIATLNVSWTVTIRHNILSDNQRQTTWFNHPLMIPNLLLFLGNIQLNRYFDYKYKERLSMLEKKQRDAIFIKQLIYEQMA